MSGRGGYFDDALGGVDGTGDPEVGDRYRDALAQDTAPAQEWGGFTLPRLPVAPGGDERVARALVEADELPGVRTAAPVPAGQWGQLQPAVAPRPATAGQPAPGVVQGWQAPSGRQTPAGWQPQRGPRPAPRPAARTVGPSDPTR